jgi:hypothetical protein
MLEDIPMFKTISNGGSAVKRGLRKEKTLNQAMGEIR